VAELVGKGLHRCLSGENAVKQEARWRQQPSLDALQQLGGAIEPVDAPTHRVRQRLLEHAGAILTLTPHLCLFQAHTLDLGQRQLAEKLQGLRISSERLTAAAVAAALVQCAGCQHRKVQCLEDIVMCSLHYSIPAVDLPCCTQPRHLLQATERDELPGIARANSKL